MTAAELQSAQRAVERTASRYKAITDKRDQAIRQAIADGWTHARIAQATGLARSRVGQIAHGTR